MRNYFPLFLIGIFCLGSNMLQAQDPSLFAYRPYWPNHASSTQHAISFSGEYMAGSDGISNSFLNHFYKGGHIDSAMKVAELNKMVNSNRLGLYAGYGAAYSWRNNPDSLKWELTLAVRNRQMMHGLYTADAFRLVFEGNRSFLGETANLSGTRFTYMNWMQFQFEGKYYSPDKKSQAVFGISALNGLQYAEMNLLDARIFTASNGTSIDATTKASFTRSDTSKQTGLRSNGGGVCFNFRFNTFIGDSTKKYKQQFFFSMQDLGYIRWKGNTQTYLVDTTIQYSGIDITDALLNPTELGALPSTDTIIGDPVIGDVIAFLPISIRVRYSFISPWKWHAGIDARLWSYADAIPHITLFGGWHTSNFKWNLMGGAAWGGYAQLQFPVQINWNPCKNFGVTVGSWNLAAYILPKHSRGQGAWMNLSFAF
jgi:Family of unknown function (DUF5723)